MAVLMMASDPSLSWEEALELADQLMKPIIQKTENQVTMTHNGIRYQAAAAWGKYIEYAVDLKAA